MHQPDELLTSPQAGLILGKSARTVARMAEAGEIPVALKLPGPNGAWLYRRADVQALLDEQKAAAKARHPAGKKIGRAS